MRVSSLIVELIDACNLACPHCLRDEDALHGRAHPLPVPVLSRVIRELHEATRCRWIQFTGGEPTLHPDFGGALRAVADIDGRFSLITNGWAFDRVLPDILEHRPFHSSIAFSLDGANANDHDAIRGAGSFERVMKAAQACREHGLRFRVKVTISRTTVLQLEEFGRLVREIRAQRLLLGPLLPATPSSVEDTLSIDEQHRFFVEVARLRAALSLPIDLAAGFYIQEAEPTCAPLLGHHLNVDNRGRLMLCSNLTSFRGSSRSAEPDFVADLNRTSMGEALALLQLEVARQNARRRSAFASLPPGARAPLSLGSSCFNCLASYGKIPDGLWSRFEEKEEPMDDLTAFEVPDEVIATEFDGKEAVVLNQATQQFNTLNETATFLWSRIEAGDTLGEMATRLTGAFDVSPEKARASTAAALERLLQLGLVRARAPLASGAGPRAGGGA